MPATFGSLPETVRGVIFALLPLHTVLLCRRVCRAWYQSVGLLQACVPCRHTDLACIAKALPSLKFLRVTHVRDVRDRKEDTRSQLGALGHLQNLRELRITAHCHLYPLLDLLSPLVHLKRLDVEVSNSKEQTFTFAGTPLVLTRVTSLTVACPEAPRPQMEEFLCSRPQLTTLLWNGAPLARDAVYLGKLAAARDLRVTKAKAEFVRSEKSYINDLDLMRRYLGELLTHKRASQAQYDMLVENLHRLHTLGNAFVQTLQADAMSAIAAILLHEEFWTLRRATGIETNAKLQIVDKLGGTPQVPLLAQPEYHGFQLRDFVQMHIYHMMKCNVHISEMYYCIPLDRDDDLRAYQKVRGLISF